MQNKYPKFYNNKSCTKRNVFEKFFQSILLLKYFSILLHTKESYCVISSTNLGIFYVFFKYSNPIIYNFILKL